MLNQNSNHDLSRLLYYILISKWHDMTAKNETDKQILQKLDKLENRLNTHETRHWESDESINWLVAKVREFEYLKDRNEVLEGRENLHSLDGDYNCNS